MTCSHCGNHNPEGSPFCGSCGEKLLITFNCDSCGDENPEDSLFCGKCGTSLGSVDNSPEPKPASKTDGWFCDVCGISNKSSSTFCRACKTTQSTKLSNSVLNRSFGFARRTTRLVRGFVTWLVLLIIILHVFFHSPTLPYMLLVEN